MKKACSLVSLFVLIIVALFMTGCSQPQYVKIGELGGTTLNLDVASVVYNKDKDIANYKIKTTLVKCNFKCNTHKKPTTF